MVWTSPVFIKDCHLSHKCGFSLLPDRGAPPLPVYHFLCKFCNTWQSNMSPCTTTQRWGGGGFRLVWTSWSVTTTSKTLHIIKKNTILKERISSKTIKIRPMFVHNRLKKNTSAVVILSVGQAVDLCSGVSGPRHSEQQWVRLDHVRVAGFELAAGDQQGGDGARLGLDSSARVWVQRNLLLPCGDLLHRTAHILHRMTAA